MKLFIWTDVANVSSAYHHQGGVVVIAKDLQAARDIITAADLSEDYEAECGALTVDPKFVFDIRGQAEQRLISFPNAGC